MTNSEAVILSPALLASLYKQPLVIPADEMIAPVAAAASPVQPPAAGAATATVKPVAPPAPPRPAVDTPPINALLAETAPLTAPVATPATPQGYKFLGSNKRNIAIVVQFAKDIYLPESHLQFLTKILGACRLNLADVAIVNHANQGVDIQLLKEQLKPAYIFLFGLIPSEIGLPISFPAFKDQEFAGCTFLFTPSLDELNQNNEAGKLLKTKLWTCLKKIFNV